MNELVTVMVKSLFVVQALKERKDKLSAIERRTQEVSQNADEFASLASQLARKYERR